MSYVTSYEYFAELRGIEKGKQEGIEKGIERGIQTGIQKGIQRGQASILMSQLEGKFKTIPKEYKSLIETANPDVILTWANRLLRAETLEEIFN